MPRILGLLLICVALASLPIRSTSQVVTPLVAPQADTILKQMSAYMQTLKQFTVHVESITDVIPFFGPRVQYGATGKVSVRRPNRWHAISTDDAKTNKCGTTGPLSPSSIGN